MANLYCGLNYADIYEKCKEYGYVKRIKIKIEKDPRRLGKIRSYVTYSTNIEARMAYNELHDKQFEGSTVNCRLFGPTNVQEESNDYIPEEHYSGNLREDLAPTNSTKIPTYFLAIPKRTNCNIIKIHKELIRKAGMILEPNIYRFGRNILIKAANPDQGYILKNLEMDRDQNSQIQKIEPHRTFNSSKGVIFSRDLMEFTEDEIHQMCPEYVTEVRKGRENTKIITLTFDLLTTPESIYIGHFSFRVKKWRPNPMLCFKCLNYGHLAKHCRLERERCSNCSGTNCRGETCSRYCLHCNDQHRPTDRNCLRFELEREVIEVANNNHIDKGKALTQLIREHSYPNSKFNQAVKIIKDKRRYQRNLNEDRTQRSTIDLPDDGYGNNQDIHHSNDQGGHYEKKRKDNLSNLPTTRTAQNSPWPCETPETGGALTDHGNMKENIVQQKPRKTNQRTEDVKQMTQEEDNNTSISLGNQYAVLSDPIDMNDDKQDEMEMNENELITNQNYSGKEMKTKKGKPKRKERNRKEIEFKCHRCNSVYLSEQCKATHEQSAHNQNQWQNSLIYRCKYKESDHRCTKEGNYSTCITLYQYRTKDNRNIYIDGRGAIYRDPKSFRLGIMTQGDRITEEVVLNLGGRRIYCTDCRDYEFETEKCWKIHKEWFHQNPQEFDENGLRPFDHRCCPGESFCTHIMERIEDDETKIYLDEHGNKYHSIEEYRSHPLKKLTVGKRNRDELESTSPPPDGSEKRNKRGEDHCNILSEGTESQSVSALRDLFENQTKDTPPINTEENPKEPTRNNKDEKTDENKEQREGIEVDGNDIYLSQLPENVRYITDEEMRTQNLMDTVDQLEDTSRESDGTRSETEE